MFRKALPYIVFMGMFVVLVPSALCQETPAEPGEAEQPALPDVIAVVGDEVISGESFQKDLEYRWKQLPPNVRKNITDEQFRSRVLEERIDGMVLLSLARSSEITVSAQEVQDAVKAFRDDFYSEEAFKAYLDKNGMQEAQLNKDVHTKILREKYIAAQTAGITVSDRDLVLEFEGLKAQGNTRRHVETVDIGYFFMAVPSNLPEEWEHDFARIKELHKRIEAGEDFDAVIQSAYPPLYATTPESIIEEIPVATLPPEVQKAVSVMEEGQLAKPFRSLGGWHLVKLFKRNPPGEVTFEKARNSLHAQLLKKRQADHIQSLVNQHKTVLKIDVKQE